jgi:hypothetical protein
MDDKTRRSFSGLLIALAVPLAIVAVVPLAVLAAAALHVYVLWQLGRALFRGARSVLGRAVRGQYPLPEPAGLPATLAFPPRR